MNSKGRLYLQKRSKFKEVNPGAYDKTIGGHVPNKHTWNMTLIRECAEELGFPATIVSSKEFFVNLLSLRKILREMIKPSEAADIMAKKIHDSL